MHPSHGIVLKESETGSGPFANAHDFVIQQAVLNDNMTINTQNLIYNQPTYDEPLSPLRSTAARTSQYFVGQEKYLEKLHEYFRPGNNSERKMFLLYGMGGIGKTQICMKFNDEMAGQYAYTFWIDATSEDTIVQSLKEIYKMTSTSGTYGSSFSSTVVLNWISNVKSVWLMIFDNADGSPELIEKFLPPGNVGNIVITSRNPALKRITMHKNHLEVSEMSEEVAIDLLLKTSGVDNNSKEHLDKSKTIVQKLHYLPLAIDMAGAYIVQVQCEFGDFIKLYDKYRPKILNHEKFKGASGYNKSVYRTWEISLQTILEMSNDKEKEGSKATATYAIILLNICAFFHYEKISESIFERAAKNYSVNKNKYMINNISSYLPSMDVKFLNMNEYGEWDDWIFTESIELLLSFSLLKKTRTKSLYSIHPLVHTYCQDRLSINEKLLWNLNAKAIIVSSVSIEDTAEEYMYISDLLPHILETLESDKKICAKTYYDDIFRILALLLNCNGKYNLEEEYRVKIVCVHLEKLVGEVDSISKSLKFMHEMYLKSTKGKNSDITFKLSETLCLIAELALTYWYLGKWADAEQLQIQVLDMRERILGQEHPNTFSSMGNLANTFSHLGKWADAEQLQIQVLDMSERILGKECPHTLITMINLAITFSHLGKWADAEQLQIQVLNMSESIFGKEHPHTITSMSGLANTFSHLGKWADAEQLQIQVLDMSERILGKEHPHTVASMHNLATTFSKLGKWADTEQLQIQVLDMSEIILGREHPLTLSSMNNLAITFSHLGKWADAEQLQIQVLDMGERILGKEHPDTLSSMDNLAITFSHLGKWVDAEQLQIQVLDMSERILGKEHPDILNSMNNLAETFSELGKWVDAEQLQIQVLDMSERILGKEHPHTLRSMNNLAITFSHLGKWEDAEQLQIQVLDIITWSIHSEVPEICDKCDP